MFDTIPDTITNSLQPDELIRRLSIGTDREARLAAVIQARIDAAYTRGRSDAEETAQAAYDRGYADAEAIHR
jgi:hypothetical protein